MRRACSKLFWVPFVAVFSLMNGKLLFITFVAALGGFLFGFDTAVISGTDPFVVPYFGLTDNQWGFTVASALLGTIVGSISAGLPADKLGRRNSLFIAAVLYLISALGCALAPTWAILVASRFVGGIGVGLASVLSPMYIAEVSPSRLRGRLVALAQLNIVIGIVVAYFSNDSLISMENNWRYMFGVEAIPATLFFVLLFFVPRSPRWLVSRERIEEAGIVLNSIYSDPDQAQKVLSEIKGSLQSASKAHFKLLFSAHYRYVTLLVVLFASFNQLTGINVFIYYAPRIFELTGLSAKEAIWQTFLSVGVTNLIFTVLAMFAIDRFGRKMLMYTGTVGLIASLSLMSYAYFSQSFDKYSVMFYLIGFIASFAFSQGAVCWVFMAEVFPNQLRNHGQSLGAFTHWTFNFGISLVFPGLVTTLGGGTVFAFFALMMVLQFFYVWKMMPETRGKSLEALQKDLVGV